MNNLRDAFFKSFDPRMMVVIKSLSIEDIAKDKEEIFELCRSALGCRYAIFADTYKEVIYIGKKLK